MASISISIQNVSIFFKYLMHKKDPKSLSILDPFTKTFFKLFHYFNASFTSSAAF